MGSTSILYQGLQSCIEPQLPQHVVINKVCPPRLACWEKSAEVDVNELQSQKRDVGNNIGGWSCIKHLSNPQKDNVEKLEVYVHPLVKRSSNTTLSIKSLEMCTESLGSETGSDISESIEDHSFLLSESESCHLARPSKCREIGKKHNRISNFPPPLTSMKGVQVRPHRENGRFILKATTISAPMSCFKAERVDGRLRLSLWNNTEAEAQDDEYDDGNRKSVSENGYVRPTKCNENGSRIKGIPSWEPFWVTIS